MPFKKNNRSLTIAVLITVITALLFSFLFLFLGINHRKNVYNDSKVLAAEISRKAAFETQVYLNSAILYAKSLERQVQLIQKLEGSREELLNMLKSAIKENINYLGVWTLWEPDAFDGKDSLFKTDPLYNELGSIGLGFFRSGDSIYYEIMTPRDYEGDYYIYPEQTRTAFLTEPYKFIYSGYNQLFFGTTVSIPIISKGTFLGAIGIDINLGDLQAELDRVRPYQYGYLSLISSKGTIITHIDSSLVTKNIFNIINKSDNLSYLALLNGKETTFEIKSEFTGEKVFRMFYPIEIGKKNKPWSMMIEIPLDKATFRSKQLLVIAIITLFVGLSLLTYLLKNISERKKYEKDLLAAKDHAEESNRLKTAFLNNISHEIRTPLNGIIGFAELLASSVPSNDEVQLYKKMMTDSSKQLLSTITNVIELSKIQSQQAKLKIGEFKINEVLCITYESYIAEAEKKNIKLLKTVPDELLDQVINSDKEKVLQVFTYLLNNALKFTDQGTIELGCKLEKSTYQFFVKDTGIGIKPEFKQSIFNYFTQADTSSKRYYDGLGVGLSISKSFVTLLGGSIWLESEVGVGSNFYFSLPAENKNA
ncbi:MAG TPA: hypothetical protein DCG75_11855 [Bacteroidales bacterium]|nr:hypothetical protein [Bacteroidales bacterium]